MRLTAAPERYRVSRNQHEFAYDLRAVCIDIVKEGFDRLVHKLEVRFEKKSSGIVKHQVHSTARLVPGRG